MRKLLVAAVLASTLTLVGCSELKGVSLGYNTVGLDNPNFNARVSKIDDVSTDTLHLQGVVKPKTGKFAPDVSGTFQKAQDGTSTFDIYVKSKN